MDDASRGASINTWSTQATNVTFRSTKNPLPRQVTITPVSAPNLSCTGHVIQHANHPVSVMKVLLKAVSKKNKEQKTFTLRNVQALDLFTSQDLVSLIKAQLQEDIVAGNFECGYLQGSTVVIIRSKEDLRETWDNLKKGKNITLWCDGLNSATSSGGRKRSLHIDSDDDEDLAKKSQQVKKRKKTEDKEELVESIIQALKVKHGDSAFTPMQYRIWSEMIAGGVHSSRA